MSREDVDAFLSKVDDVVNVCAACDKPLHPDGPSFYFCGERCAEKVTSEVTYGAWLEDEQRAGRDGRDHIALVGALSVDRITAGLIATTFDFTSPIRTGGVLTNGAEFTVTVDTSAALAMLELMTGQPRDETTIHLPSGYGPLVVSPSPTGNLTVVWDGE